MATLREQIRESFDQLNRRGFASIDLKQHPLVEQGSTAYVKLDTSFDSGKRGEYYNELAFFWPEDWDHMGGIGCYHDKETVEDVYTYNDAVVTLSTVWGPELSGEFFELVNEVKSSCIEFHQLSDGRRLKMGRVMLRQMSENEQTNHRAFELHEDIGYSDRPARHFLSAAITIHGKPTEAKRCHVNSGDLLIFNTWDRRDELGLSEEYAFRHKGPRSGPKLFLFFEFLLPRAGGN